MKTGKFFRVLATGAAIVCLAAGCAKNTTESSDRKAILFSVPATRSAVTSLGEGDAFAVWARQSSAGAAQMILRQETVRCAAGVWSYDNVRYWQQGATYDFYALYPHDVPQAVLADTDAGQTPRMTVTDFDTRRAEDLMVAEKVALAYAGSPSPVVFTFRHLLSKVEIVGRIDPALEAAGVSCRIVSATLYGLPATGSGTVAPGGYGTWSLGGATTASEPFASAGDVALVTAGQSVFGELLLFPQAVSGDIVLEIVYECTEAGGMPRSFSKTVALADAGVNLWEPSMSYRYIFVASGDYILFEKPEVSPWRSASGGIVTVE